MDGVIAFLGGVAASSVMFGSVALWRIAGRRPRRCMRCKALYYPMTSRAHYWEEYCSEACQLQDMADYD